MFMVADRDRDNTKNMNEAELQNDVQIIWNTRRHWLKQIFISDLNDKIHL